MNTKQYMRVLGLSVLTIFAAAVTFVTVWIVRKMAITYKRYVPA